MSSKLLSRRDLSFLLYEWLNVESLTSIPRYADHSRETFDAALDTCERIATDLFAPHNKKNDQEEPHFDGNKVHIIPEVKAALDAFNKAGLMAAGQDFERGGMQLPTVVEKAGFGYFKAANVGTSSYPFLTIGNANLLLAHGTPAQIETFVQPEMEGRFYGTMCLSEPQAGSSLSDVVTRAEYEGESPLGAQYRLTGNKMWISAGEHELSENIVHLVLAKIPGPDGKLIPGVKGISLFIVPKFLVNADGSLGERNDVVLAGLNLPAELWRGHAVPPERCRRPAARRCHRLPRRRAAQGPCLHVPHDERGAHRRRHGRNDAWLHGLSARGGLRAQSPSRSPGRAVWQGCGVSANPYRRSC